MMDLQTSLMLSPTSEQEFSWGVDSSQSNHGWVSVLASFNCLFIFGFAVTSSREMRSWWSHQTEKGSLQIMATLSNVTASLLKGLRSPIVWEWQTFKSIEITPPQDNGYRFWSTICYSGVDQNRERVRSDNGLSCRRNEQHSNGSSWAFLEYDFSISAHPSE